MSAYPENPGEPMLEGARDLRDAIAGNADVPSSRALIVYDFQSRLDRVRAKGEAITAQVDEIIPNAAELRRGEKCIGYDRERHKKIFDPASRAERFEQDAKQAAAALEWVRAGAPSDTSAVALQVRIVKSKAAAKVSGFLKL